jgi:hypothetical protein
MITGLLFLSRLPLLGSWAVGRLSAIIAKRFLYSQDRENFFRLASGGSAYSRRLLYRSFAQSQNGREALGSRLYDCQRREKHTGGEAELRDVVAVLMDTEDPTAMLTALHYSSIDPTLRQAVLDKFDIFRSEKGLARLEGIARQTIDAQPWSSAQFDHACAATRAMLHVGDSAVEALEAIATITVPPNHSNSSVKETAIQTLKALGSDSAQAALKRIGLRTEEAEKEKQSSIDRWSAAAQDDAIAVLRQLCLAYSRNDSEAVAQLEDDARAIGEALNSTGGFQEMRRVFKQVELTPGSRTLDMHWDGIGDWRG